MNGFISCLLILAMLGCAGDPVKELRVPKEKLAPCPNSPNCVSSQSVDAKHAVAPLRYSGTIEAATHRLLDIIRAQKRAKIVQISGNYMHAEFTSALFGFVDDVEFLIDDTAKVIHVRSASQVGYYDLGVNRQRVNNLRSRFENMHTP